VQCEARITDAHPLPLRRIGVDGESAHESRLRPAHVDAQVTDEA
jgi:hypothetical protein